MMSLLLERPVRCRCRGLRVGSCNLSKAERLGDAKFATAL
jgi:hypothetical protein